jgi:RNA polymerase sigma-70 factor, ECF subfamily
MATAHALDDEELVRLAQLGEMPAFTALYDKYLPVVYRRVRYAIPEQDVEDVTQEIFIAVIRSLKSFRGESQFKTWLRTITNRQVADFYRRRTPPNTQVNVDISDECLEHNLALSGPNDDPCLDEAIQLRQAMKKLPANYQEVLLLRFADGLRFSDIAQLQGQTLEGTKSLFRRAVAALQREMTSEHEYGD